MQCVVITRDVASQLRGEFMPQMFDVKAIMNEKPKAVTPEDPIHKAAEILHRHDISHLPVIDNNKHVVGHVHTNDVLKAIAGQKPHTTLVKHIMRKPPVVLPENTPIAEAAARLAKARVKGAPVVNHTGQLSGFVHVRDIEEKVPNAKPHVDQICNACKLNPKKAA